MEAHLMLTPQAWNPTQSSMRAEDIAKVPFNPKLWPPIAHFTIHVPRGQKTSIRVTLKSEVTEHDQ